MLNQEQEDNSSEELREKYLSPSPDHNISKSQKIAVVVLAFFAIFIVILWSIQFKKNLSEPFEYKGGNSQKTEQFNENSGLNEEEVQKNSDTDNDGLSDWDEVNLYKTSPYLEDSDSDGFSDKQELDSDNDPNCPSGRDCYGTSIPQEDNTLNQVNTVPRVDTNNINTQNNQSNLPQQTSSELEMLSNMDATTLRQMLLEKGMDKNMLDQLSDDDLMESFQEVLGGMQ